ncbi:hypothetical protein [Kitasatospora cineracea]|uniref:hypothetical protein n=1 Tax=Kitasatospora cineracea TaxID=88074 RepID=UPI000F50E457|nr:hypothetical protein [Kitasatospora cineracea]
MRIAIRAWDKHRVKGLFGLDAMLTADGGVFLNEINRRTQDTTEVSVVNQQLRGLPPFLIVHLTTMLDHPVTWPPDLDDFNAATVDISAGLAPGPYCLKFRRRGDVPVRFGPHFGLPGVYRVDEGRLRGCGPAPTRPTPGTAKSRSPPPVPGTVCEPGAQLGTAEGITTAADATFASAEHASVVRVGSRAVRRGSRAAPTPRGPQGRRRWPGGCCPLRSA